MILLDTNVLIWTVIDPHKLSRKAASTIRRARNDGGLGVSAITLWELANLFSRGHVRVPGTIEDSIQVLIDSAGVSVLPLTPTIVALASQFPEDYSRDPADRIIGGTARAEGISLVTKDERILQSRLLQTIW